MEREVGKAAGPGSLRGLVSKHYHQRDGVGDNGGHIKNGGHIGTQNKMVEHPRNKGEGHKKLKFNGVFYIHKDDIYGADQCRQHTDKALFVQKYCHYRRNGDQQNLPDCIQFFLIAQIVSEAGQNIAYRTGNAAQQQDAHTLHQQLQDLHQKDLGFFLNGAGTHLQQSGKKIDNICDDDCHKISPLFSVLQVYYSGYSRKNKSAVFRKIVLGAVCPKVAVFVVADFLRI